MIIAILAADGAVSIVDRPWGGGAIPSNWRVPCPSPFRDVDARFLTHDGQTIQMRSQEVIDAIKAADAAAQKESDALGQAGTAVAKALAKQINALRVKTGLAAYSAAEWKELIKAEL